MYGSYDMCPHKTFLSYGLGLHEAGNKKAELGNVLHKVCECLALAKKHYQDTGEIGGFDVGDEYIGVFKPDDIYDPHVVTKLTQMSHIYHASISEHIWTNDDLITTLGWMDKVVTFQNGAFDPRNKKIAHVEKFFDFELEHDWAKYDYKIGDKQITGSLGLKGTVDLIMDAGDSHYEVLDYKSGKRLNWATGEEKTYEKLQTDPQLLLYYYACCRILPDVENFDFTIYYVNDGGPFTMCFDEEHKVLAEELIKKRFLEMKNEQHPRLISPTRQAREKNFRCKRLCHFAKTNQPGTDVSICEFFQEKIKASSADEVMAEYGDLDKIGVYGDGGGRKAE